MYNKELKSYGESIKKDLGEIDKLLIDIKVNIHNIEKLGKDTKDLEKQVDNVGIELYKLKNRVLEK
jgi:hypothetical protein